MILNTLLKVSDAWLYSGCRGVCISRAAPPDISDLLPARSPLSFPSPCRSPEIIVNTVLDVEKRGTGEARAQRRLDQLKAQAHEWQLSVHFSATPGAF